MFLMMLGSTRVKFLRLYAPVFIRKAEGAREAFMVLMKAARVFMVAGAAAERKVL
jgi:hypothetical protein